MSYGRLNTWPSSFKAPPQSLARATSHPQTREAGLGCSVTVHPRARHSTKKCRCGTEQTSQHPRTHVCVRGIPLTQTVHQHSTAAQFSIKRVMARYWTALFMNCGPLQSVGEDLNHNLCSARTTFTTYVLESGPSNPRSIDPFSFTTFPAHMSVSLLCSRKMCTAQSDTRRPRSRDFHFSKISQCCCICVLICVSIWHFRRCIRLCSSEVKLPTAWLTAFVTDPSKWSISRLLSCHFRRSVLSLIAALSYRIRSSFLS